MSGPPAVRAADASRAGMLPWLLAGLLPLLLYAPTWRFGFVFDDLPLVVQNPALAEARFVPLYFTRDIDALARGAEAVQSNYYRPVALLVLAGLRALCGSDPVAWHVAASLLFALCGPLAMGVLVAHGWRRTPALVGALLFAAHPAHVPAAAWVAGLQDTLAGLAGLAAYLAYRRWVGRPGNTTLAALAAAYALALLTKEAALGLLPVLLVAELLRGAPAAEHGARWRLAGVLLGLTVAYALVRWSVLGALAHRFPTAPPFGLALASLPVVLVAYVKATLWPVGLTLLSPLRPVASVTSVPVLASGAVLILAAAGIGWRGTRARLLPLGWFLGWLAPCLNLWALNPAWLFMSRYLFLPVLALPWLLLERDAPGSGRTRTVAALLLALAFAGLTLNEQRAFVTEERFWARQLEADPGSSTAWTETARLQLARGQRSEARRGLERATQLDPAAALPRLRLANLDLAEGRTTAALEGYLRLTREVPGYAQAWRNVPVALAKAGDLPRAIAAAEQGLAHFPGDLELGLSLSALLRQAGRRADALALLDALAREHPRQAQLVLRRAWLMAETGDLPGARRELARLRGLDLEPNAREGAQELERALGGR